MKRLFLLIILAIVLMVGTANAVTIRRDIYYTGTGYIQIGNDSYELNQINIHLLSNGLIDIEFTGNGYWTFEGTWYYTDISNMFVDLNYAGNFLVQDGTAGISFDNGRFGGIVAAGRINNVRFILNFNSYVRTDYNGEIYQLHIVQSINGSYVNADETMEFNEIGIDLEPDGNAFITLYGVTNLTINGTWRQRTIDSIEIGISSLGDAITSGSGIILLENMNAIALLNAYGSIDGQQWSIYSSNE